MIWLTWRQHRKEVLVVLGVLVVAAAFLLITGINMAHTFQDSGLGTCLAQHPDGRGSTGPCAPLSSLFLNEYSPLIPFASALLLVPILLGVLVGAPLVAREYEQRTRLLVWMQSITRTRWMIVTLALAVGIDVLAAGLLLALLSWWYHPFDQVMGKFNQLAFDYTGPVFIAASLMCIAVGIAVGALTRRTVLAIFLTVALIAAIRIVVEFNLRPNDYQPPVVVTWPFPDNLTQLLNPQPPITVGREAWVLGGGFVDAEGNHTSDLNCHESFHISRSSEGAGATPTVNQLPTVAPPNPLQCAKAEGYKGFYIAYQPADRFWTFQWIETGIYLAISALALGVTVWWVRRRLY